jgi:transcription antitermination factor NusG
MEPTNLFDEASWYAVSTRSRQEKVSASMLESFGIPHFLPLISEKRQWSDRKQVVRTPLFPGYLFVRVPKLRELQLLVLRVPGIVGFIGNHRGPEAIPDDEIDAVRLITLHEVPCTPCPVPAVGTRVRIVRGVLAGIEGTLVRSGSDKNLVLSVETIHQSIAMRVDSLDIELAGSSTSPVFAGAGSMLSAQRCS